MRENRGRAVRARYLTLLLPLLLSPSIDRQRPILAVPPDSWRSTYRSIGGPILTARYGALSLGKAILGSTYRKDVLVHHTRQMHSLKCFASYRSFQFCVVVGYDPYRAYRHMIHRGPKVRHLVPYRHTKLSSVCLRARQRYSHAPPPPFSTWLSSRSNRAASSARTIRTLSPAKRSSAGEKRVKEIRQKRRAPADAVDPI
ncbi:hypothetical protein BHM03_00011692 [Ensete ventricosum]|nr:hypothetical protein BHM03_00011692 [Ensete ventricosum]